MCKCPHHLDEVVDFLNPSELCEKLGLNPKQVRPKHTHALRMCGLLGSSVLASAPWQPAGTNSGRQSWCTLALTPQGALVCAILGNDWGKGIHGAGIEAVRKALGQRPGITTPHQARLLPARLFPGAALACVLQPLRTAPGPVPNTSLRLPCAALCLRGGAGRAGPD